VPLLPEGRREFVLRSARWLTNPIADTLTTYPIAPVITALLAVAVGYAVGAGTAAAVEPGLTRSARTLAAVAPALLAGAIGLTGLVTREADLQYVPAPYNYILAIIACGAFPGFAIDGADLPLAREQAESGFALGPVLTRITELADGGFAITVDAILSRRTLPALATTPVFPAFLAKTPRERAQTDRANLTALVAFSTTSTTAVAPTLLTVAEGRAALLKETDGGRRTAAVGLARGAVLTVDAQPVTANR